MGYYSVQAPKDNLHDEQADEKPQRYVHREVVGCIGNRKDFQQAIPCESVQGAKVSEIEGHSGEIGEYVKEEERNKYGSDFLFQKGNEWLVFEKDSR